MATRTRYSILKGIRAGEEREVIACAAKSLPGPRPSGSKWSDWTYQAIAKPIWARSSGDTLTMADDAWQLAGEISRRLSIPHLELRVQESDHWDFTLYVAGEIVADFSTRVGYFNDDPSAVRPWKQGGPTAFASAWKVPLEDVAPYLVDWDTESGRGLVGVGDAYAAGDWRQIFDFMDAIGAPILDDQECFEFSVPAWQSVYKPQPWWRRIVRRISVSIKGTYPDVPRRTPAEDALWNRRKASIRIEKI